MAFFVYLGMSLEERKARLVNLILSTDEDELIHLIEEDIVAYNSAGNKDAVAVLSEDEHAELKELMEEPTEKDTISFDQFKANMEKWRTRSA